MKPILNKAQKRALRKAQRHEARLFECIRNAHRAGKPKCAAYWTRRYLNSVDAKHVALVEAYRDLKPHRRPGKVDFRKQAEKVNPWRGTTEPVVAHLKAKESNAFDFRLIMDFGLENRALQQLVERPLMAQAGIEPHQFMFHGGRPRAVEVALDALAAGFNYVTEIDIRNFYPSVNGGFLHTALPLPPKITHKVIEACSLPIIPGNLIPLFGYGSAAEWEGDSDVFVSTVLSKARTGIPQGSGLSPLVGEIVLAPILAGLPDLGRWVSFADNILLMSKNKGDGLSMIKALGDALYASPAGPFEPKETFPIGQHQEFDYLGYCFFHAHGHWHVRPTEQNLENFDNSVRRGVRRIVTAAQKHKQEKIDDLKDYVVSWTSAFSAWPDVQGLRLKTLARTDRLISGLGK